MSLQTALEALKQFAKTFWSDLSEVFTHFAGRLRWEPPDWAVAAGGRLRTAWYYVAGSRRRAVAVLAGAGVVGGVFYWYLNLPTPHYVAYTIENPGLTEYDDKGISSIKPMKARFVEAVAPLKDIEKQVTEGLEVSPSIAGTWFWVNDRELQFTPRDDWPIDTAFTVRLNKKGFLADHAVLEDYSFTFRTQPFSARFIQSQFYQDPIDPNLKKIVATVQFSHPVDSSQFEQHVSLDVAKDAEYLGLTPDSRHFTLSYDKFRLAAFIHSAALGMPRDETSMTVRLERGIRAARGGNATRDPIETKVMIPGRLNLRFSDARMTVVDNARYEPEQVLLLKSSSPVEEKALAGKVNAYVLPVRHPKQPEEDQKPYRWVDAAQIGNDILGISQSLPVTYVPSEEPGNTTHAFKLLAPVGRYIFVAVKDGVEGTGGYLSGKPYIGTIQVEPYPQALTFLGQGALLSMSGDKQVGFLVRDVDQVEIEIGRVLPNQLQHLAMQMWDFAHPYFGGLEDQVVERFSEIRDYSGKQPGKPTYDSINLTDYLQDKAQGRRGLFLLHLRSRPINNRTTDFNDYGYRRDPGIQDDRLILVTDLGFIVKQANDGSRDVFVESIRNGEPVAGARVELIGRNGEPVMAAVTDAGGRAELPPAVGLRREKAPLLVLAQKGDDFSFMPLRTQGRSLDMSRFDTGGVENAQSAAQLSSYLFSDRGIYRPGETAHLGVITRTADWQSSLAGLPIDIEITDPRGIVVSTNRIKVSATAFDEVAFTSQPAAPTGTYQAGAYLVKDPKNRELLGSTSFRVQEFEPDRMKVRLDLSDKAVTGWLTPNDVQAKIAVAHLFGEAAGNRRVDGEMNLTSVLPRFTRYPDYRFQIGRGLDQPYHENLAATVTDTAGNAELRLDLKRFVGRAYRLNVLARAYEAEGGRNVGAQNSAIISDASYLVGVKPDGDLTFVRRNSARQANWLAVNQQLEPVAAEGLKLEWVQQKYVSVLTQQTNQTYQYVSRLREIIRDSQNVRVAAGGSNFVLPTEEPGDFVLVLRDSSGAELNRLYYSVAGQANIAGSLERNAELQVQLDRPAYKGGDTITVSIRAPYIGSGLMTIERERVFEYRWFKTTTTSSVQKIDLPLDFEGNGYVNVQFLRDPASDELFLSPLSYGVAAFSADLASRTQSTRLTAPREVKPGATMTMRVTPGKASRVALVAVDEGILQVARYKNPDPLGYFFQKRMLAVNTSQILDLILPDFKRFVALAAPGGDADGSFARNLNPFNKKRKPPVAFWSGLLDVGPNGRDIRYTVPDYFNGRLRIFTIAVSSDRIGVAEAATEVKGDFILTPNVPTMVAPDDDFIVSVGVFNNTTGGSGPIRVEAEVSSALAPQGTTGVELEIAQKQEGTAEFRFKANPVLGPATLKFTARRGAATAQVEESVSVRPAVAYRTQLTLGRIDDTAAEVVLTRDLYSEQRKVEASISALPLVWGQGLTAYLGDYSYFCTEQVLSKGMSLLLLVSRSEFGVIRNRTDQPLANTFAVLESRQNDQGGLGLWASSPETAEFPTVYAAHFLVEAKERNQAIPQQMLTSINDWLARFASTPASTLADGRVRAYAVYLLARQGIRPTAALSNVEQELTRRYPQTWQTDLAAAYLAATYRIMQRNNDADRMIGNVPWSQQKREWSPDDYYYDAVVHDAQLLYLLARHFPDRVSASPSAAIENIGRAVSGNRVNSLSAASILLALDAYAKSTSAVLKLGITEIAKDGNQRNLVLPAGSMPKAPVSEAASRLRFTKDGQPPAFYSINESGFDRNASTAAISQGVEIIREFVDMNGNVIQRVQLGQEFLVRLRLRATSRENLPQIAVVDLLPGGVEAVLELRPPSDTSNAGIDPAFGTRSRGYSSLPVGVADKSNWRSQHIDLRDDRLVLYGDATRNAGTFVYRVRATNAGVFQVPPAFAEGLYDRTVSGVGQSGRLEVVKP
jgi:alpha-2-macroglobulin